MNSVNQLSHYSAVGMTPLECVPMLTGGCANYVFDLTALFVITYVIVYS